MPAVLVTIAIAALAPGVLVPPAMVIAIVETFARLGDDAPGARRHERQQQEHRPAEALRSRHKSLRSCLIP